MAENLYPAQTAEILAEEINDETDGPIGYMDSVYFEESIGDFVRDGHYRLKGATGIEAWEQWCINCLLTERDAYPSYGSKFGIATKEAFKAETREEAESILTLEINEGLMNDPYGRTEAVEDIIYNWIGAGDGVEIIVTVRGIEDVTRDITVIIDSRAR